MTKNETLQTRYDLEDYLTWHWEAAAADPATAAAADPATAPAKEAEPGEAEPMDADAADPDAHAEPPAAGTALKAIRQLK